MGKLHVDQSGALWLQPQSSELSRKTEVPTVLSLPGWGGRGLGGATGGSRPRSVCFVIGVGAAAVSPTEATGPGATSRSARPTHAE